MVSNGNKSLKMKNVIFGGILFGAIVLTTSTTLIAYKQKQNELNKSVLITDENRDQIGKETFSDYYIVNRDGKFINSLGNEISQEEILKKNR